MVRPSVRSESACGSRVTTTPPSTSPWPARYFVTLWTLKWAPKSRGRANSGVANVLSTTSAAPTSFAMAATRSISPTRSSGLEMLSITMPPGWASATTARKPARSQMSAKRTLTPNGSKTVINKPTVAPYIALAATMERRRSVSALRIAGGRVAAFQRAHQFFQRGRRRVVVARVAIALLLVGEDAVQLRHGLVEIAGRGVDRRGNRNVRAAALAVSGMHRLGVHLQVLLPLPAHAALGVFQDDALLQKLVPNPVGEREVAGFLGRGALHNQCFNVAIGKTAGLSAGLDHLENGIEEAEKLQAGRDVAGAELARIHGAVGVAHELEDGRQRFGRIEIVVEAFGERLRCLGGARQQLLVQPFGEAVGFQAQFEIAQPVDGNGRRFHNAHGTVG